MLSLFKKIAASALIIGSFIFAVLIFAEKNPHHDPSGTGNPQTFQAASETLPDLSPANAKNLTQEAAQNINEEISSYSVDELKDPLNQEKVAGKYLAEAAQNFDYNQLKPHIDIQQLHVVPTSDRRFVSIYLKGFDDAISTNFQNLKTVPDDLEGNLELLRQAYDQSIKSLYAMPIPSMFVTLHQKTLAILGGEKSVADIILQNYQSDPIRALLAFQAITGLNAELKTVQKDITDLANKNS